MATILSAEERRQRNREEMERAILEAARAVMREHGAAGLSLREVARRVRLQAPSLYAYFPSKAAIYNALFLTGIRLYVTYRTEALEQERDFWSRLHAQLDAYMRFAHEHPDLYQLAFERPVPGFVPSKESMAESHRLLASLEQGLTEAAAQGDIRLDIPISQARDLIIAMSHGLTSQHMANEPQLPAGSGRYGGLIPAAVALFRSVWEPPSVPPSGPTSAPKGATRHAAKGGEQPPSRTAD